MRWLSLLVVCLAVTAGCNGFGGLSAETTVTPAPVSEPATSSTEQTPESAIAPGVGGGRIIDANRLASAHRNAIRNRSYVWHEQHSATRVRADGTLEIVARLEVENERRYYFQQSTSWSGRNVSEYTEGASRYRRVVKRAGYRHVEEPATDVTARLGDRPAAAVARFLSIGNATVRATDVDGRRYYRITGTTNSIPETGQINNYNVRALVSSSGFVRALTVSYIEYTIDDRRRIEYQYEYADVGNATVSPPKWVTEQWPNNTTATGG